MPDMAERERAYANESRVLASELRRLAELMRQASATTDWGTRTDAHQKLHGELRAVLDRYEKLEQFFQHSWGQP